jgi:hypothetical protein
MPLVPGPRTRPHESLTSTMQLVLATVVDTEGPSASEPEESCVVHKSTAKIVKIATALSRKELAITMEEVITSTPDVHTANEPCMSPATLPPLSTAPAQDDTAAPIEHATMPLPGSHTTDQAHVVHGLPAIVCELLTASANRKIGR